MNILKEKKDLLPAIVAGALTGAQYGNSMVWAAVGSIAFIGITLLAKWADKRKEFLKARKLRSNGRDNMADQ